MNNHQERMRRATQSTEHWEQKSKRNVEKWDLQDPVTLLLATMEEMGELATEIKKDAHFVPDESDLELWHAMEDIERLGEAIQDIHEERYEGDDGEPVDDPPRFEYRGGYKDRAEEETHDTGALLIQLLWSMDEYSEKELTPIGDR